jgi:hypothetical protein
VACKELEFVLTLGLVINIGVCVDTVACKKLEFVLTLASKTSWCLRRHTSHSVYTNTRIFTSLSVNANSSSLQATVSRHSDL